MKYEVKVRRKLSSFFPRRRPRLLHTHVPIGYPRSEPDNKVNPSRFNISLLLTLGCRSSYRLRATNHNKSRGFLTGLQMPYLLMWVARASLAGLDQLTGIYSSDHNPLWNHHYRRLSFAIVQATLALPSSPIVILCSSTRVPTKKPSIAQQMLENVTSVLQYNTLYTRIQIHCATP